MNVYFLYDVAIQKFLNEVKSAIRNEKATPEDVWELAIKRTKPFLWFHEVCQKEQFNRNVIGLELFADETKEYRMQLVFDDLTFVEVVPYWLRHFGIAMSLFFDLKNERLHIPVFGEEYDEEMSNG